MSRIWVSNDNGDLMAEISKKPASTWTTTTDRSATTMHKIRERDIPKVRGEGITVKIAVLERFGDEARIQIQDCGVHVRQGETYTVPSEAIRMWWDEP